MRPSANFYHANIVGDETRSSCALNRASLSPRMIGSEEFQANPQPIEIDGARAMDRRLFERLEQTADAETRGRIFHEYLTVKFRLEEKVGDRRGGGGRSVYSYVHLLRAWGMDSNGQAGAVLKAWAESRFGLLATYHQGPLADDPGAREAFRLDRMKGAARSMGVLMQLDLLYTFCQDELRRRLPDCRWKTLYRGTHDPEEYSLQSAEGVAGAASATGRGLVQLNNLSSFTSDPEVAWEFGSRAWEAEIPLSKIVFFSGLLPRSCLAGESEHLVLGGWYQVRSLLF
jgi:NAD+--dinitrogen-reductase ADP-D-ribosyltransferase